jgi:hypothetical protein
MRTTTLVIGILGGILLLTLLETNQDRGIPKLDITRC